MNFFLIYHFLNVVADLCVLYRWNLSQSGVESRIPTVIFSFISIQSFGLLLHYIFNINNLKNRKSHVVKWFLISCVCTFVYFIGAILLGADLKSHVDKTLQLSILLAVLSICPLFSANYSLTNILSFEIRFTLKDVNSNFARFNLYLTLAGAWFGVFPIALDWMQPWQVWPSSCCVGAVFGHLLCHVMFFCYNSIESIKDIRLRRAKML